MRLPEIHRIVLTGGPCAGKSTALAHVTRWLTAAGVQVYRAPEASTMLLAGGASVVGASLAQLLSFQRSVLRLTLTLEESFLNIARSSARKSVLVCDRGAMDGAAYLPAEAWKQLLDELRLEEAHLLEQRYDSIIHLVTAAIGAEDWYGAHTNSVRYESLQEARGVDERLRQAWRGHPNLHVIDNATDFDGKLHRVLCSVCEVVGLPPPREQSR
jgi:predicted ATPase